MDGVSGKLLKDLSNSIKDFVAPDPPSGQPITQCFIMRTGFSINPDDYKPDSADGPKNLAMLFNDIPKISAAWEISGKFITDLWNILLTTGKAPLDPPPTPEAKQRYKEAIKKLYGSEKKFENLEKSDFYKSLNKAEDEVTKSRCELELLKTQIQKAIGKDASQAVYNSKYQQMSPPYLDRLEAAQEQLLLRQREISRYTTALFAYNTGSLETLLENFATRMRTYEVGSGQEEYYQVNAFPSNWYTYFESGKEVDHSGWTEIIINQNYSTTSSNDTYTKIGGGVGFSFFSFKTKGGKTVKTTAKDEKGLSISFKVKTVDIVRPWMDTALFDYTSISIASATVGQWSTGKLEPANQGSFPLLPTSMVLATDITVTASSFSSHTKEVFEEFSASVGVIWDLFCFSGGGSHKSDSCTATWDKESQTMKVSGVQIIGYSCSLIPRFPNKASE